MKNGLLFSLFLTALFTSCEKTEINVYHPITDGFCIRLGNKAVITPNDIEYYDYSANLLYLKKACNYLEDFKNLDSFVVFANKEQIYKGTIWPSYSSYLPKGPVIRTFDLYPSNLISIDCIFIRDLSENVNIDPRDDERIVNALKKFDQFHEGLHCEIKSIKKIANNKIYLELKLSNPDTYNYYYLDPDKMGVGLFHYFTNGLFLMNNENKSTYRHKINVIYPKPWNLWKMEWLTLIKSKETKTISITYENFDSYLPGSYNAFFQFPGLTFHVEKKDIKQLDGRIWLGELNINKEVIID